MSTKSDLNGVKILESKNPSTSKGLLWDAYSYTKIGNLSKTNVLSLSLAYFLEVKAIDRLIFIEKGLLWTLVGNGSIILTILEVEVSTSRLENFFSKHFL